METKKNAAGIDSEVAAIGVVYGALESLDEAARTRVVDYVANMLAIRRGPASLVSEGSEHALPTGVAPGRERDNVTPAVEASPESSEGISPIAQRWMKRNGLDVEPLSKLFSLGSDEIELVSKTVPGGSKRQRMLNVFLLKGVAAYLGGGVARVSDQQVRETCLHYDAFDSANFAAHVKQFAADISGNKQSGYTLTARGLAAATDLVKEMTQGEN